MFFGAFRWRKSHCEKWLFLLFRGSQNERAGTLCRRLGNFRSRRAIEVSPTGASHRISWPLNGRIKLQILSAWLPVSQDKPCDDCPDQEYGNDSDHDFLCAPRRIFMVA